MRRRRGAPHRRPSAPASRRTEQVTGPPPLGCGPFSLPGLSQGRPLPGCLPPSRPLPGHPSHPLPDRPPSGSGRPSNPDFPERNCLPIRIFDSKRPGNPSRAEKTPRNGHETAFWHGSQRFSSPAQHAKGPLAKKTPGRRFSSPCERPQAVPERGFVAKNNGFSRTGPTAKPFSFARRL